MPVFEFLFDPIESYNVRPRPRNKPIQKDKDPGTTNNEVKGGKEWVHVDTDMGFEADRIKGVKPTDRQPELDGWDTAYLRHTFRNGIYDQALATRIKSEWATPDPDTGDYPTNAQIVKNHTTTDGRIQSGYSLPNVKRYTTVFSAAHRRRLEEAENKK